jgi:penicillin-binding protein 2
MLDNRKRYLTIQEAFDTWKDHMVSMGYGYPLGIDLPGEKRGFIPNSKVYNSYYRTYWSSSTIISIAIGQGEVTATPLQICNLAATIANRGYFITPHVVKEIDDYPLDTVYTRPRYTSIDTAHYSVVAAGMRGAVLGGTCWALNMPGVEVCGKTGTVENSHGKDHSACISFAPYNDPQIAICVFIENGGFGATNAIPVARLMLEKFFYGSIQPESLATEERVLNTIITPY